MKLGIVTEVDELQKSQWVTFDMPGFEDDGPEKVRFLIRPWTRTTQALVERRSKAAGHLEAEDVPRGTGDSKSEKYTRALADYLLQDWENVCDSGTRTPLECNQRNRLFLFENIDIAVWIVEKAKSLNTKAIVEEAKNSES